MFNKYKKKILLILTLVFLFNFSFGYKRAEASAIAAAGIGVGVVLLAAAGVAITSPQMAKDLGGRLWDGLKEVAEVPKKIGDFFKVQITGAMIEFTSKWINKEGNIPTEPVESVTTEIINFPHTLKDVSYSNLGTVIAKYTYPDKFVTNYSEFKIPITINGVEYMCYGKNLTAPFNSFALRLQGYQGGEKQTLLVLETYSNDVKLQDISLKLFDTYLTINTMTIGMPILDSMPLGDATTENKVTIPYSPQVGAGASTDKLTTRLPVGSTVTYPSDLTTNFPATQDKPISNVTDIPGVQVDTNVNTETGVIEGTLTNIAELLQSLVNSITNIFVPPAEDLVNIDLSPLYFGITDKFPFSVPFDLIKTFQNMSDSSKAPRFEVKFPEKYFGSYTFVIDFEQFNDFVLILRYFLLLSFIVFLILQTRNIIGG